MSEPEWSSTTTPEEGTIVYVLAVDNIGQYGFHSRSFFETIAGGTLAREKSLTLLSRAGDQQAMSNDEARCIWRICRAVACCSGRSDKGRAAGPCN